VVRNHRERPLANEAMHNRSIHPIAEFAGFRLISQSGIGPGEQKRSDKALKKAGSRRTTNGLNGQTLKTGNTADSLQSRLILFVRHSKKGDRGVTTGMILRRVSALGILLSAFVAWGSSRSWATASSQGSSS
jgi:hypothetical protein